MQEPLVQAAETEVMDLPQEETSTSDQTVELGLTDEAIAKFFENEENEKHLKSFESYRKAEQRTLNKAHRLAKKEEEERIRKTASQKIEDDFAYAYFQNIQKTNPAYWQQLQRDPETRQRIMEVDLRRQGIDPRRYTQEKALEEIKDGMVSTWESDERFEDFPWEEVTKEASAVEIPFKMAEYLADKRIRQIESQMRKENKAELEAFKGEILSELHGNANQPTTVPGPSSVSPDQMSDNEILMAYGETGKYREKAQAILNNRRQ